MFNEAEQELSLALDVEIRCKLVVNAAIKWKNRKKSVFSSGFSPILASHLAHTQDGRDAKCFHQTDYFFRIGDTQKQEFGRMYNIFFKSQWIFHASIYISMHAMYVSMHVLCIPRSKQLFKSADTAVA